MSDWFVKLLNMSITAGWVVLAVVVLRLLLKRAPRWITCLLWGAVALRLVCPFSFESVMSLIPSKEPIPQDIAEAAVPEIHTGIDAVNLTVNPYLQHSFTPNPAASVNPLQVWLTVAAWAWLFGMCAMLIYSAVSFWRLKWRVRVSLAVGDGVYLCDDIISPFILGIFRPRIFLPTGLDEKSVAAVIAHEKAHLKRRDHWIKPFGFLLLAVHWFNPLLWLAYVLLCRDIEVACDEKVVKTMDVAGRQAYSAALVCCSSERRVIAACPLAFGEAGVKARVKAVLNYKRPSFWIVLAAVIATIAVAVCFLTDPRDKKPDGVEEQTSGASRAGVSLTILSTDLDSLNPSITVEWKNGLNEEITYGEPFVLYRKEDGEWQNCLMMELVWTMPAYIVQPGKTSEKEYRLIGQSVVFPGDYRLEASFRVGDKEETAWVEFNLTRGTTLFSQAVTFKADALWYCHETFSYVMFPENAPPWRVVNGHTLYELPSNNTIELRGVLQPVTLNEDNFDYRLRDAAVWGYEPPKMKVIPTVEQLRKDNRNAWELNANGELYMLLEQKDGSFLMGVGTVATQDGKDVSYIRWLYSLTTDKNPISLEQPAVDGAIFYYDQTTAEHETPRFAEYYAMKGEELSELLADLESLTWVYDGLVDRTQHQLDGQMYLNNRWVYFGYGKKVIAYGTHFATMSDDVIARLKAAEEKAKPYTGI